VYILTSSNNLLASTENPFCIDVPFVNDDELSVLTMVADAAMVRRLKGVKVHMYSVLTYYDLDFERARAH
jgi:hypothetical protein